MKTVFRLEMHVHLYGDCYYSEDTCASLHILYLGLRDWKCLFSSKDCSQGGNKCAPLQTMLLSLKDRQIGAPLPRWT